MYRQNPKFSPMKDTNLGMRNSSKITKTGLNTGGARYRNPINRGNRATRRFGNNQSTQQFNIQDVSKLKELCTVTNQWIKQKSSELLDVLKRTDYQSGDNCHRTVTVQSRMGNMDFGRNLPSLLDRKYRDNDFQQERNRGFEPTGMSIDRNSYQSKPGNNLYALMENLCIYAKSKPSNYNNSAKLFAEIVHAAGTSYSFDYIQTDKSRHKYNLIVENLIVGTGESFVKKKARLEAYSNAMTRLKTCSVSKLIDSSNTPEMINRLGLQHNIERDITRPISALVVIETAKASSRREKNAMSILRRSVYYSKMDLNKVVSMVGNMHKVILLVQNKPVGVGLGTSVTKASINAAGDALFNNFYRNNPVLQTRDGDDSTKWIPWTKIKFLAKEIEGIHSQSLSTGPEISGRSYETAIKKVVDMHPWSEVDNELIFGPGMSDDCVQMLSSIAQERNLSFERRRAGQLGVYFIIQRYYDPIQIVRYLGENGGRKGRYCLISKNEIVQTQCDHWEPASDISTQEKSKVVLKPLSSKPTRRRERDRNSGTGSIPVGNAFNNGTFNSMSNDGGFDQKFAQGRETCGFNDGEFRQMSRSDNEYRPRADFYDRELEQMRQSGDRGFGQMQQSGDRGFGQMQQSGDRGFGQMQQSGDRGFGQMRQTDDRGFEQRGGDDFGQGRWRDDKEFGQMSRPDDREFGQMSRSNYEESNQTNWQDRREFTFRPHDKELNQMPGSHDREFRETSRLDAREFGRMHNLDNEFMERGMSDREFNHDKNRHDERRFNTNYDYTDRDFNQISDRNEREFNSQFRSNEMDRGRFYDDNYNRVSDVNKERFGQNPYDNQSSGQTDIGLHHSSNYDGRFNDGYDKQLSNSDNRHYNQLSQQSKRDYDRVTCDDNARYAQGPNYDDNRSRFNNDQFARMDHQMNQDGPIDSNRTQSNAFWNKMQDQRGDGRMNVANSRMYPGQMSSGPSQENMMKQEMMKQEMMKQEMIKQEMMKQEMMKQEMMKQEMMKQEMMKQNMMKQQMMKQNMMKQQMMKQNMMKQNIEKNQLTALTFINKKIAHNVLHANVKGILANARRLSSIARARSRMESTNIKAPLNVKHGKGIEASKLQKRAVPVNQAKTAPFALGVSQNSKGIRRKRTRPSKTKRVAPTLAGKKPPFSIGDNTTQKKKV